MTKTAATSKRKQAEEDDDETPAPASASLLFKSTGNKKKPNKKSAAPYEEPAKQEIAHEDGEHEPARSPKKKAKSKHREPEPEPEAEEEVDGEVQEDDEETTRKKAKANTRRNKKCKLVGYRNLARIAGYIDRVKGDTVTVSGIDGTSCLTSIADAKRCMRFTPATAGSTNFGLDEFSKRHELFKNGVPTSAARPTQVHNDIILRSITNNLVLLAAETGKKTISASMVMSVLRPYVANMLFTAVVPPIGVIRHAQDEGVLAATEQDAQMKVNEKKENAKTKQIAEAYEKSEQERLAKRKAVNVAA